MSDRPVRLLFWGTYDTGKPRNRIPPHALRECGAEVSTCHRNVWKGVVDKSLIHGWPRRVLYFLKWLASYPGLLIAFSRTPKPDYVVVPYLWHLDVLVLWPFARMRRRSWRTVSTNRSW